MGDVFSGFKPRPGDKLIAMMGMTGSGKSTFISLCTGKDVPVGHDLQAYTEVLIEIAACLTQTYEDNIKLSGILYLHRITDRRLGGSAKKNLMMFRKLCGTDGLKNVILVTTMWEDEQKGTGAKREQELIETNGFWGALVEEGAQVNRHDNTRQSAKFLLKSIAKKDPVIISIQKEMVSEHKDLNETEAGKGLNSDILMAEQRVKKEMLEALQMERQARMDQDKRSAEELSQFRESMQEKIDHLNQERENLKISLQEMKEQRRPFTELEEKYQASQERLRQQEEKIESLEKQRKLQEQPKTQKVWFSKAWQNLRLRPNEGEDGRSTHSIMQLQDSSSYLATGTELELTRLSLAGRYYSFSGPHKNVSEHPHGLQRAQKVYHHRQTVAIGTRGSWFYHYHTGDKHKCETIWSDSLSAEYPELVNWLETPDVLECPRHISLGADGNFFIKMKSGKTHWCLPTFINARLTNYTGKMDMEDLSRLWLGYGNNYVAEIHSSDYLYNADNYGRLPSELEQIDKRWETIKQLAMDIKEPGSYMLIKGGGASIWHYGYENIESRSEDWQSFIDENRSAW
ncbi:hypothetical protein FAVG1_06820 [Fusarium avenaceum]|nr:hypothetical protein FAVG1_06820 [Fusarium avenaceum]